MMSKIKLKEWITDEEAQQYNDSIGRMGGCFENGMRGQKDYFDKINKKYKKYYQALRNEIIKNKIIICGDEHQYGCGIPLFSDNTVGSFSYRSWGDLMAAIWSEELDQDFCYMDFYMGCTLKNEKKEIIQNYEK